MFPLPHIEPTSKRIRVLFGSEFIVDTTSAKLVWTHKWYPHYFFKVEDVPEKYLTKSLKSSENELYDLAVGDRKVEAAVTKYVQGDLAGLVSFDFGSVDGWFEEAEQFFEHPKDPYKRVDTIQSTRHVRVEFNGVEVANTKAPRLLYETMLHVRTYIPITDCRLDLLVPSDRTTKCPYKGIANYYHICLPDGTTSENSVWWYRTTEAESFQIKGFLAFYDEKLDVFVDGVKQPR